MRRCAILVTLALVVLATIPPAAGEGPDPSTPIAAVVLVAGQDAIVSWVPGAVEPDSFRIYGVTGASKSLLATVPGDDTQAVVPASFPSYAVTSVSDGVERRSMIAVQALTPCVGVYPDIPPDIVIGCTGEIEWRLTVKRSGIAVS